MKAGAAGKEIRIPAGCLPLDDFDAAADPLYVRVILLEDEEKRCGIVSFDVTNLYPGAIPEMKQLMETAAGVKPEDCWITVTHNFTTPHLWETPKEGEKDVERPGHPLRSEEELARCRSFNQAFFHGLGDCAREALRSMEDVTVGGSSGFCTVNASRNVNTPAGWWLGISEEGYADHTVPALVLKKRSGKVLAVIFSYDCQSTVMGRSYKENGYKTMTSDLLGNAAVYVEHYFGGDAVALALCGCAGDQEPMMKACYVTEDSEGNSSAVDLRQEGYVLLRQQARRLGSAVIEGIRNAVTEEGTLACESEQVLLETKGMERDLKKLHPVQQYDYVKNGEELFSVELLRIGRHCIVGTKAELSSAIGTMIRGSGNGETVLAATMVNGAAKYMVDEDGYRRFTYGAINSRFMPGSAEKLAEKAIAMMGKQKHSKME